MDCPDEYTLSRFVEGDLPVEKQAAVSAHLACCADCQLLVDWANCESTTSHGLEPEGGVAPQKPAGAGKALGHRFERGDGIGRYIVLERIGQGAMGVVYSAYDPELDRKVALKVLRTDILFVEANAEASTRLLREAQAMARVVHANVVSVHDVVKVGDDVVIAMEFVHGVNLMAWLREHKRSWREVVDVFLWAGRGLEAAHNAGLVHRDFKPANILISETGRVCVSDFGLAKGLAFDLHEEPQNVSFSFSKSSPSLLDSPLTHTDVLVGTPGYMAPEQLAGRKSDARSDQFAFCVALYEALYGFRPFAGNNLGELRNQIGAGEIRQPGSGKKAPKWVRQIVVRGLHAKPEHRFPTMHDLLDRLAHNRAAIRRRRRLRVGLVGLFFAAAVGTYLAVRTPSSMCRGAEEAFVGVWDAPAKERMKRAFVATGRSHAAETSQRVERHLDAWTQLWVTHHTQACEAAHFVGSQSAEILDLRMTCLRRKLGSLRALVELFTENPDASVVDEAVKASAGLGRIAFCADVEALKQAVLPPEEPQIRLAVEKLRNRLEKERQNVEVTKFQEAAVILAEIRPQIEKLDYPPLQAELELLAGRIHVSQRQNAQAEAALQKALRLGLQWKQRDLALRAAQELLSVVGFQLSRRQEALTYAQVALGLSQGLHDERVADSRTRLGLVLAKHRENAEAEAEFRRALALYEEVLGPEHPSVARPRKGLAKILFSQGKVTEAEAEARRVHALLEKALGPEHPRVASSLMGLGTVLYNKGDFSEAETYYRNALAVRENYLGPEDPEVASSRSFLGYIFYAQGKYAEAEAEQRRAFDLRLAAFGSEHPAVAASRLELGNVFRAQGRYTEAETEYQRVIALYAKEPAPRNLLLTARIGLGIVCRVQGKYKEAEAEFRRVLALEEEFGPDNYKVVRSRIGLAHILHAQGKYREAEVAHRSGLASTEKVLGLEHPDLLWSLPGLGDVYWSTQRYTEAKEHFGRAVSICKKKACDSAPEAQARFGMARILWREGKEKARAIEQAKRAREGFAMVRLNKEVAKVETWLKARGVKLEPIGEGAKEPTVPQGAESTPPDP